MLVRSQPCTQATRYGVGSLLFFCLSTTRPQIGSLYGHCLLMGRARAARGRKGSVVSSLSHQSVILSADEDKQREPERWRRSLPLRRRRSAIGGGLGGLNDDAGEVEVWRTNTLFLLLLRSASQMEDAILYSIHMLMVVISVVLHTIFALRRILVVEISLHSPPLPGYG